MSTVEPLADAVTGGLAGRALEPSAGEVAPDGHTAERDCLNCGVRLTGDFCHACGQRAHVHRSLRAFGHDLLHGVFHFEGKVWRTLPMLAWRPGELTRRYIEGQRASFVSPIALFLFSIFLMFAVLSATGALADMSGENVRAGIETSAKEQRAAVQKLEGERAAAVVANRPTAEIDRKLESARDNLQATEAFRDRGVIVVDPEDRATVTPWLRGPIQKFADNPELLFYKLRTNAYKFSWMLIPLSVPFVWLLFPFNRRFRMYDHTVFVTYSLSFITLLAIMGAVLTRVGLGSIAMFLWLVPPIHMYRQLKDAYGLGRTGALWRTVLLLFFATIASSLFVTILLALGIFE